MNTNGKVGPLTCAAIIDETDELYLISDKGTLVRIHANKISLLGRSTQGVRLIKLKNDEILVQIEPIKQEFIESDNTNVEDDGSELNDNPANEENNDLGSQD